MGSFTPQSLRILNPIALNIIRDRPMKSWPRLAGRLPALVGALGCVMSGIGVSQTWSTARSLRHEVPQGIGQLEEVGRHLQTHGESAVEVVQTTRSRLSSILVTVEELSQNP